MKKILLIISIIFLMGCASTGNTQSELPDGQLFQKKKECASKRVEIEKIIERDYDDEGRGSWLGKIFYSPKRNSCLYTMETMATISKNTLKIYTLFDAFTNEKLIDETGCLEEEECGQGWFEAQINFDAKVLDYE